MLDFERITIEKKEALGRYLRRYGENSCQHSFATMYCMHEKYGDMVCEKDGFLYILRSGRCTEAERVYLFPMGDISDGETLRRAVGEILEDAHARGARVCFETLTKRAKEALLAAFPGQFKAEEVRDYAEYLYTRDKLAFLPGHEMASKRHDINTFFRDYGDRVRVEAMGPEHLDEVRRFQMEWLEVKEHGEEDVQLELENEAIQRGLCYFEALGLSGICVYIDGELRGYAYGAPLSEDCYDVMIEKGDRSIPDIYRVLNRDLVRMCCQEYDWINREEDVGVEGLRRAKLSYKPDLLLEKYIVKEASQDE